MLILIVVPLVAGIESLFVKKENARAISILAGLCAGALLWNAYCYRLKFPTVSIVFVVLALVSAIRLFRAGAEVLKKGLVAAVVTLVVLLAAWHWLWASPSLVDIGINENGESPQSGRQVATDSLSLQCNME